MTIKLFDYVNSIYSGKENLVRKEDFDDNDLDNYVPIVVNRALSNNIDTIFHANIMNLNSSLDSKYQYEFLFYSVRKKKRYNKWYKYNEEENLSLVCEIYDVTPTIGKKYLKLLNPEQIEQLKNNKNIGGIEKKND